MKIHISDGNSKLGAIPSISLTPIASCVENIGCASACYAVNIIKRFPVVSAQWRANLSFYKRYPVWYFVKVQEFLAANKPSHFRFHIGGDCPDKNYADMVVFTAKVYPSVQFLIFTKRYTWFDPDKLPPNLSVILSVNCYVKEPVSALRKSYIRGDIRAWGLDLFKCEGKCTECLYCFDSKNPMGILLKPH